MRANTNPKQKPSGDEGAKRLLGPYQLIKEIGQGAAATVYEGVDTRIRRRVAVKVLNHARGRDNEWYEREIARFLREARAIGSLSHPNIVTIYDIGEQAGDHFIVMELLSGTTLREHLDHGALPLAEATAIVSQIAGALDAIHDRDIVHRDIKPSNIMLVVSGDAATAQVKLLDFGVARLNEDATMTHAGTLIGSPAYMSPEQVKGDAATPRSDVWALGVLLYEMLTARQPFKAPQITSVLYQISHDEPAALEGEAAAASEIIECALAKRPELRFASAGEMARALQACLPGAGVVVGMASSTTAPGIAAPAIGASANGKRLKPAPRAGDPIRASLVAAGSIVAAIVALTAISIFIERSSKAPHHADVVGHAARAPVSVADRSAPRSGRTEHGSPTLARSVRTVPLRPAATGSRPAPVISVREVPPHASAASVSATEVLPAPHARIAAPPPVVAVPLATARHPATPPLPATPKPSPLTIAAPVRVAATPEASRLPAASDTGRGEGAARALIGTWNGAVHNRETMVVIDQAEGNSFSGKATVKTASGPARFEIAGNVGKDANDQLRVSFMALRQLPGSGAADMDFGQQSGHLVDGHTLAGLGKDMHFIYAWTLRK